jgi:chemotaxis protein methyltransferase CheR
MQDLGRSHFDTTRAVPPDDLADPEAAAVGAIARLVRLEAGLEIGANRHAMIRSRLARRLRSLGLGSITAYRQHLEAAPASELPHLISCLTTNVSSFFREPHHFDLLGEDTRTRLIPSLARGGRARLWSAGCALGQEPWSMAMLLSDLGLDSQRGDVRILATDIDPTALSQARAGNYPEAMLTGLSPTLRDRHMAPDPETQDWSVLPKLRDLVTFRELNLIRAFPMRGPFDVVFCRNVMIYFDDQTQLDLCRRIAGVLREGGLLCIGHSERIAEALSPLFVNVGLTAYRRTGTPVAQDPPLSGRNSHGVA